MHTVYVIENENGELYFGCTNNLKRRLFEHNEGRSFATKGHTWTLIYCEVYRSESDAYRREQRIKDYGQAWRQLKERFKDSRQHES